MKKGTADIGVWQREALMVDRKVLEADFLTRCSIYLHFSLPQIS